MANDILQTRAVNRSNWTELLTRLSQARDQQVFMALYDHFAPRIASYLQRLGAEANLVEELTQETMLAVWRKANLYNSQKAAASTWIFTIARNQYIDQVRRQGPVSDSIDLLDGPELASEAADVNPDAVPLQRAIEALPVLQSQVLVKSYYEGMSHSEIAAELNIPLGSVKSNIRLAFQKLRTRLRPTS